MVILRSQYWCRFVMKICYNVWMFIFACPAATYKEHAIELEPKSGAENICAHIVAVVAVVNNRANA